MNTNISTKSTAKELNQAVKELNSEIYRISFHSLDEQHKFNKEVAKPQFERIYQAITDFEVLNKRNILIMFRLNLKFAFIPFHSFGMTIKLFLD